MKPSATPPSPSSRPAAPRSGWCSPGTLYRPGRADQGRALKQNSPALAGLDGLRAGTWDAEVGCGLADLVVDKVRFDASQWTSLEPLLRGPDPPPARAVP